MTEIEIKLRWSGERGDPRQCIESLGYPAAGPRTLEIDQLYDRPTGELRHSDCVLRLRQAATRATVTFKGPANRDGYKSREEIEFDVSDAAAFELVLEKLGYQP
jgi:predicted adenylyl cyclase CyaB